MFHALDEEKRRTVLYFIKASIDTHPFVFMHNNFELFREMKILNNNILEPKCTDTIYPITNRIINCAFLDIFVDEQLILRQLFIDINNSNLALDNRESIIDCLDKVKKGEMDVLYFINFIHRRFPDLYALTHLYQYLSLIAASEIDKGMPRYVGSLKDKDLHSLGKLNDIARDNDISWDIVRQLSDLIKDFEHNYMIDSKSHSII